MVKVLRNGRLVCAWVNIVAPSKCNRVPPHTAACGGVLQRAEANGREYHDILFNKRLIALQRGAPLASIRGDATDSSESKSGPEL